MGRARWVRPEFFKHERLATLSPLHRLLFIGLWTQADRAGRLEDRPMRLKVECLPYDDCDVDAMIDDLERHPDRLVRRYERDGRFFLDIPAFTRLQNIHPREADSELPEIPTDYVAPACIEHACSMHARVMGDKGRRVQGAKTPKRTTPARVASYAPQSDFDVFYAEYPKKKHRPVALRAWQRNVTIELVPTVMSALRRQIAEDPEWQRENGRFIPYPASWLNGERWTDEIGVTGLPMVAEPTRIHRNDQAELDYLRKRGSLDDTHGS